MQELPEYLSEKLSFTLDQELSLGQGDAVPEYVQVLPSGRVDPKGKPPFEVDEEAAGLIMSAFGKSSTDLVIDYEHQSLAGIEAPAAGWIKGLDDRGGEGIWARVQWTARAQEYLMKREYRYLSPVVLVRKRDGRAVELLGAALTNLPAIDGMMPVVNAARPLPGGEAALEEGHYKAVYEGVLSLMGLPEGAGLEAVKARVASLMEPSGFVRLADYEALKARLKARETDALIKEAMTDGRLTPPLVPWARSYAAMDIDGFREYLGRACPAAPLSARTWEEGPTVDHAQREVNRLLGIKDEDFVRGGHDKKH